jgi:hypothetical protein
MLTDNKKKEGLKQTLFILVRNTKNAVEHYYGGEPSAERKADLNMNLDGEQDYAYKKIATLCESIRAEALKEVEGEIEKLYNEKYSHVTRDYRTEDQFRDDIIGQHGVLAKLS